MFLAKLSSKRAAREASSPEPKHSPRGRTRDYSPPGTITEASVEETERSKTSTSKASKFETLDKMPASNLGLDQRMPTTGMKPFDMTEDESFYKDLSEVG